MCYSIIYTKFYIRSCNKSIFWNTLTEIVPLNLSFAFWVLPCKHFSNSVSLLSSKSTYRLYFKNNVFWKTCPGLQVWVFISCLYQHQLSEPMRQCGYWYILSSFDTIWNNETKKLVSYFAVSQNFEEQLATPS